MGALISLFVTLISLMISLTMSLFMTMINLLASLLGSSARASSSLVSAPKPRQVSQSSGGASDGGLGPGAFVLLVILGIVAIAMNPRAVLVIGVLGVLAVLVALRFLGGPKTPAAQELAQRFKAVRTMSGTQFEIFVADLLRAMGYNATVLGGSGDQGVDVIVTYQGKRVAVQCKNYGKAVGNKPVQEVYAGSRYHGCNDAWVIAPAGFTKGAVELAERVGVSLYTTRTIRTWIRRIDKIERGRDTANPAPPTRRVADLDTVSTEGKEDTTMESGMEKHTVFVGSGEYGETVRFTANKLGTASVNGGPSEEDGLDLTVYRLPDGKYRVLAEKGDVHLLQPSNFLDVFGTDQPAEYGRWTYEEAEADETYGDMFQQFMAQHPAGRKHVVRDLD